MSKKLNAKARKERYEKEPWIHFSKLVHQYSKRIKNTRRLCASVTEIQYLWFFYRAWNFKKPQIQRVNIHGPYTMDNLTFMEGADNGWNGSGV